jgi:hypothetical protein
MTDDIIIPGGFDEWSSRRWDAFVVARATQSSVEHTVFDWCMIYTNRHPRAFLGDDSRTATARCRDIRLTLLGAQGSNEPGLRPHPTEADKGVWDDRATYRTCNALYQELAQGISRIDAKKVYLDDRPSELDPTLCIIGSDPVLAIARRNEDFSLYIAALLARTHTAPATATAEGLPGKPRDASPSDEGGETDSKALRGEALDCELDKWARDRWPDLTKLPSRDELLSLARRKPEFSRVNQFDIRALRRRLAPEEIRKGGARLHHSRRGRGPGN